MTARRSFSSLLDGVLSAFESRVEEKIEGDDLGERDPDSIRDNLPWLWLLASVWFRADVRGLDNIPERGPALLVGNHSGGNMTPDTLILAMAFSTHFGAERPFYQLAHNLILSTPLAGLLRRFGTVAATPDNARRALDAGAVLLVYPGGDHEVSRPIWERNRIDFAGRRGFVRQALEARVPLIPVVSIGGQETALFLTRGVGLARTLRLDRNLRLKTLPISIAAPWGLNVGDFFGHVPLPAKITIQVLPAIDLDERFGPEPDVDEVYGYVVATMQRALDGLSAERRLPVVG